MMREFNLITCVDPDGIVRRHHTVTKIELGGLSPAAASENDFKQEGDHWVRTITLELVARELRHAPHLTDRQHHPEPLRLVGNEVERHPALPEDDALRDAWVRSGDKIVHDLEKAKAVRRAQSGIEAAVAATTEAMRSPPVDPAIESATTIEQLKGDRK